MSFWKNLFQALIWSNLECSFMFSSPWVKFCFKRSLNSHWFSVMITWLIHVVSVFIILSQKLLNKNTTLLSHHFSLCDIKLFQIFSFDFQWLHRCPEPHIFSQWLKRNVVEVFSAMTKTLLGILYVHKLNCMIFYDKVVHKNVVDVDQRYFHLVAR